MVIASPNEQSVIVTTNEKMPIRNFANKYANVFHVIELVRCACMLCQRVIRSDNGDPIGGIATPNQRIAMYRSNTASCHHALITSINTGTPIQIISVPKPNAIPATRKIK